MYIRKTEDEYQIHGNYGYGWEEIDSAGTRSEALYLMNEYIIAYPSASYKIVKKRVRKEDSNG